MTQKTINDAIYGVMPSGGAVHANDLRHILAKILDARECPSDPAFCPECRLHLLHFSCDAEGDQADKIADDLRIAYGKSSTTSASWFKSEIPKALREYANQMLEIAAGVANSHIDPSCDCRKCRPLKMSRDEIRRLKSTA